MPLLLRNPRASSGGAFLRTRPGDPIHSKHPYRFTDALAYENFLIMDREDHSIAYRGQQHSLAQCTEATCYVHFYPGGDCEPAPVSPVNSRPASPASTDLFEHEDPPADDDDLPTLGVSDFADNNAPAGGGRALSPTISELDAARALDPRQPTAIAAAYCAWRTDLAHERWDRYFASRKTLQLEELGRVLMRRRRKYAKKQVKNGVEPRKSRRQRQGRRDDLSEWGALRADIFIHAGFWPHDVPANGGPRPMVDLEGFVTGLVAPGPPDHPNWALVHGKADAILRRFLRNGEFLPIGESRARYGLTCGHPHKQPENIPLAGVVASEIAHILESPVFRELAAYQTHLLQQFFPNCFTISMRQIAELRRLCPDLSTPFPDSPFTTGEINFGDVPLTTRKNLSAVFFLIEAITPVGKYDDLKGGQLVCPHDDSLTRFGPGMTALIPTGTQEYVLAAVGKDEHRFLFRQFFCARVFRWVEKGGRDDAEFDKVASQEEREAWEEKRVGRTEQSINYFSKLRVLNSLG